MYQSYSHEQSQEPLQGYKMFQTIALVICVYFFTMLLGPIASADAADKQLNLSLNYNNQDIKEAKSHLLCSISAYKFDQLYCNNSTPLLRIGICLTYNEKKETLSIFYCPYFQSDHYIIKKNEFWGVSCIELPNNLSHLNNYMCGPMNRKDLVCSECADGFGPSVTSFGYKCANCSEMRYAVPLFLFLELAPLTIFYIICLAFQISVTSAPMPCLIMYAQLIVITFDSATSTTFVLRSLISKAKLDFKLDIKIPLLLYRIFNLEFGHYLLPPYCLSSKLKFIHIAYLGYISAFYPLLLIFLTWACVELHGRNFRLLVWLWRPFHRWFVRLRRGWDAKSDIIDVFTTFFLLSYSKIMYQTLLLLNRDEILNINRLGKHFISYQCTADQSISYGSTYHLLFAIPSVIIFCICNILPSFLLILYPIRAFRSCLSKCHLNSIAVNIFTEKVYACYRNGLDEGRDMRSIAGLYFILRFMPFLTKSMEQLYTKDKYHSVRHWYYSGSLFLVIALIVALARPYRRAYMNYLDIFILSDLALIYYAFSCGGNVLLTIRILLVVPISALLIAMIVKITCYSARQLSKCTCAKFVIHKSVSLMTAISTHQEQQVTISSMHNNPSAAQPLIEPTSTVVSYDTCTND